MKRHTIVCKALLTLSAAPDAFGWGAVSGPRGGPPIGAGGRRGVHTFRRGCRPNPSGAAAARGPYGGTAVRGPSTEAVRCIDLASATGRGRWQPGSRLVLAGAAAASSYSSSCYYPPYYCHRQPTTSRPPGNPASTLRQRRRFTAGLMPKGAGSDPRVQPRSAISS
jgi:hypothetical protein